MSSKDFDQWKRIGHGAFSEVFQVVHKKTLQSYALKMINMSTLSKSVVHNLQREIDIHSKLSHDNIVKFYGHFYEGDKLYILLEHMAGGNLFHYIRNRHPLMENEVKSLFSQILKAFKYLHAQGVVMRDLKPENIVMDRTQKVVKLCDFGWSCYIEDKEWLVKMAGTYAYMAPESLKSQMQGFETDIWALGILLFELYHGYEPFKGNDAKTVLKKIELLPIPFVERFINKTAQNLICAILKPEKFMRLSLHQILEHEYMKAVQEGVFIMDPRKFFSMREIQ